MEMKRNKKRRMVRRRFGKNKDWRIFERKMYARRREFREWRESGRIGGEVRGSAFNRRMIGRRNGEGGWRRREWSDGWNGHQRRNLQTRTQKIQGDYSFLIIIKQQFYIYSH